MSVDVDEKLLKTTEDKYGFSTRKHYHSHALEIYKLYLDLTDKLSARRQSVNSFFLSTREAYTFLHERKAGWFYHDSIKVLEELCTLLYEKKSQLSKQEFEQIRAYGKRWKSKACWKPLRKPICN